MQGEVRRERGYLDAATAAPLHPVAAAGLAAALDDGWADPARLYAPARRARQLLDAARGATAEVLGVRPDELSLHRRRHGRGARRRARRAGRPAPAWARWCTRRSSTRRCCTPRSGTSPRAAARTSVGPVDRLGRVDLARSRRRSRAPGVGAGRADQRQPRGRDGAAGRRGGGGVRARRGCRSTSTPRSRSAGSRCRGGWSLLTASAHKWGGPPGVGLLVVRKGTRWRPPCPADERERGVPGVADLPAIVAAAASLRAVAAEAAAEAARLRALVDRIRATRGRDRAGRGGGRRPGATGCRTWSRSPACTSTARRCCTRWTGAGSRCRPARRAPRRRCARRTCWRRWACCRTATSGCRCTGTRTEADVERFLAELPGIVAGLRAEAGVVGL